MHPKKGHPRKKKLIKKIQLYTAFKAAGLSFLSFILIAAIIFGISEYVSSQISSDTKKLADAVTIQRTIVSAVETFARSISSDEYELSLVNILKDSNRSFALIDSHIRRISLFVKYHLFLFIILFVVQLVFMALIFRYIISLTHSFLGPEKVIAGMLRRISAGEKIRLRPLRSGDHLNELYDEVVKLAERRGLVEK